jgi:hypothetical protein
MTTSSAVGALAAELLIGGPEKKSAPFSPQRFAAGGSATTGSGPTVGEEL